MIRQMKGDERGEAILVLIAGKFKQLLSLMYTDFNGIRTHDLCDSGAMLFQLSYELSQLAGNKFMCSRERTR